jgi:hypothetical protein
MMIMMAEWQRERDRNSGMNKNDKRIRAMWQKMGISEKIHNSRTTLANALNCDLMSLTAMSRKIPKESSIDYE